MKRKRKDYTKEPWTPFVDITSRMAPAAEAAYGALDEAPVAQFANSRYHVALWFEGGDDHPLGRFVHLSIKDHGRSAKHDWRDFQRIKNELVGPEYDAIEIYPAEDRLVDTANQYHLYVFKSWRVPVGFFERLVADGGKSEYAPKAEQRPFEVRPDDCLSSAELDVKAREYLARVTGGSTTSTPFGGGGQ